METDFREIKNKKKRTFLEESVMPHVSVKIQGNSHFKKELIYYSKINQAVFSSVNTPLVQRTDE